MGPTKDMFGKQDIEMVIPTRYTRKKTNHQNIPFINVEEQDEKMKIKT